MKKVIGLLLATMLLVMCVSAALAESQGKTMYVCTKNGKALLVRSSMSTKDNSNVIGYLQYGEKVVIYGTKDGWAMIDYKNKTGYIMSRFLVKSKPADYKPSGKEEKKTETSTVNPTTVAQMNALAASAKSVEPYTVVVRPTRASGWVYLRWFPSKSAQQVATFRGNYELTVIAELKDWFQVSDPATGKVGFIYKTYIAQ